MSQRNSRLPLPTRIPKPTVLVGLKGSGLKPPTEITSVLKRDVTEKCLVSANLSKPIEQIKVEGNEAPALSILPPSSQLCLNSDNHVSSVVDPSTSTHKATSVFESTCLATDVTCKRQDIAMETSECNVNDRTFTIEPLEKSSKLSTSSSSLEATNELATDDQILASGLFPQTPKSATAGQHVPVAELPEIEHRASANEVFASASSQDQFTKSHQSLIVTSSLAMDHVLTGNDVPPPVDLFFSVGEFFPNKKVSLTTSLRSSDDPDGAFYNEAPTSSKPACIIEPTAGNQIFANSSQPEEHGGPSNYTLYSLPDAQVEPPPGTWDPLPWTHMLSFYRSLVDPTDLGLF